MAWVYHRSMRTVAEALEAVDRVAPLDKAASWDPVGLQLGDLRASATRVGVCHEVTDAVVDRAVDDGIDLLVAYHPLLFRATRTITTGPGPTGRAFRLLRAGIGLVVVHTAMDVVAGGCADSLADALDLEDIQPFGPLWGADAAKVVTFVPAARVDEVRAGMVAAGAGGIGRYSSCSFELEGHGTFVPGEGSSPVTGSHGELSRDAETRLEMIVPAGRIDAVVAALVRSHPYDEPAYDVIATRSNAGFLGRHGVLATTVADLAAAIEARFGVRPRVAGDGPVKRVTVIPGSGGDFMEAAAGVADVIVTGDVGHHRARAALDRGLAVIDPGHAVTEQPGVARLYASLASELGDVVDLTGLTASPWKDG